jgi:hypothetical protein
MRAVSVLLAGYRDSLRRSGDGRWAGPRVTQEPDLAVRLARTRGHIARILPSIHRHPESRLPSPFARRLGLLLALAAGLAGSAVPVGAQSGSGQNDWDPAQVLRAEHFIKPPARIAEILTTPRVDISFTNHSPDQRWFLRATGVDRSDVSVNSAPRIYLGGLVLDAD